MSVFMVYQYNVALHPPSAPKHPAIKICQDGFNRISTHHKMVIDSVTYSACETQLSLTGCKPSLDNM